VTWPILIILLQGASSGVPMWVLLWAIDRLCRPEARGLATPPVVPPSPLAAHPGMATSPAAFSIVCGDGATWPLQTFTTAGTAAVGVFSGEETLSAEVFYGDDTALPITPTVSWIDGPSGQYLVAISAIASRPLVAGSYTLVVKAASGPDVITLLKVTLIVEPAPELDGDMHRESPTNADSSTLLISSPYRGFEENCRYVRPTVAFDRKTTADHGTVTICGRPWCVEQFEMKLERKDDDLGGDPFSPIAGYNRLTLTATVTLATRGSATEYVLRHAYALGWRADVRLPVTDGWYQFQAHIRGLSFKRKPPRCELDLEACGTDTVSAAEGLPPIDDPRKTTKAQAGG
jgi:hypothetical protein